jgi:hypothetical protein
MSWIDFFIGFTLMNAMPHFVLGVWQGRVLSAFGFGNKANIAYSLLNFSLSVSLFAYKYGILSFLEHPLYLGAITVLVIYYILGKLLYSIFKK